MDITHLVEQLYFRRHISTALITAIQIYDGDLGQLLNDTLLSLANLRISELPA